MKTFRLVMLLACLLIAGLATGRAAGGSPGDSVKVCLPLILNDARWISQTRFPNRSGEFILDLIVDGKTLITEDQPLADGGSITLELAPGEHQYTVTLGTIETGGEFHRHYRWKKTFTQEPLRTTVETIDLPALADVLSGFKDCMHWDLRQPMTESPTGFYFYSDGSYLAFTAGSCPKAGRIEEGSVVTDTREFDLIDSNDVVQFKGRLHPNVAPFVEFFELLTVNGGSSLATFWSPGRSSCPPVPDECSLIAR